MSYTAISDFKYGMDRRRPQTSGVPGTLWVLRNAVITRGGDIERTKKFVAAHALPAGTFGGFSVRNQIYVFGAGSTPSGMPVGVRYQQLAAPGAPAMSEVLDAKGFDGKVYAIAAYADGNIYHFYDGARVTDWDALADAACTHDTVAARLAALIDGQSEYTAKAFGSVVEITAAVPGTDFTLTTSVTDASPTTTPTAVAATVQANVAAVAETRATGTVTITGGTASADVNTIASVTVDGVELLLDPVDWIGSNSDTANALAVAVNDNSYASGYSAAAVGAVVTLTAAVGTGAGPNGDVVAVTKTGDVTFSKTNIAGGVTAVAAVAKVATVTIGSSDRATATVTITGGTASAGVNKITSLTANGVTIASNVDWTTSNDATATALASAINGGTGSHGYSAAAVGAVVTITSAADTGKALDGAAVAVTVGGDVTATKTDLAWVSYATDTWTITLDGDAYKTTGRGSATGTSAFVNKRRIRSTAGPLAHYSKINDPTDWSDTDPASGAGFINVSSEVEGAEDLVGMAKYESSVAMFGRDSIVIYDLPADAENSSIVQALENTGTLAPRSVVAYGANDVFYLDETGIRSLRMRDSVQSAYASDIGSAFDPFVQDVIAEVGAEAVSRASAVIEGTDGRYMLALGQYVLILSQFPASRIVAWSYLDFGEQIDSLFRVDRTVYLRAGDTIYAYGGVSGDVYPDDDEFVVLAETPFISAKDPAALKMLEGFDMAAENTWRVQALPRPDDPSHYIDIGYIEGTTYHLDAIKVVGETSHYALRMTCAAAGRATLSSVAVHHSTERKE